MKNTYITRMINKPGQIATLGGVHNRILINAKHIIGPDALRHVNLLPMISDGLSDRLAHILDDKLLGSYVVEREQTPIVDARLGELERLLPQLQLAELEHLVNIVGGHEAPLERPRLPRRARRTSRRSWRVRLQIVVLVIQAGLGRRVVIVVVVVVMVRVLVSRLM